MKPMTEPNRLYSEFTLVDLLDAFSSNAPVPGGGSAAAVAGALGVSLLIMASGLPKSRTGAPDEAADLAEAGARLRPLRDRLTELIDEDGAAYTAVMDALRLPKTSTAESHERKRALQAAMIGATDVPVDVMRVCQQALAGGVVIARNAYRAAASDVTVGIELLVAALRGCAVNIAGNLSGVTDAAYVERIAAESRQLSLDGARDAAQALELLSAPPPR
jgi:formiminotetrahydrofolate cyclodeaminase